MRPLFVLLGLLGTAGWLQGQAASPTLAFEAASVRRGTPGAGPSLRTLVAQAYQVADEQLVAPEWIRGAFFDIDTRMPPGAFTRDGHAAMMRALLTARFGLAVHRELRDVPVYELRLARGDRRLGPALRRTWHSDDMETNNLREQLQPFVARPILDKTGLTGDYDLRLRADAPSVFIALREQLGLKLEPGRGPVDVLVVDRIAPPAED